MLKFQTKLSNLKAKIVIIQAKILKTQANTLEIKAKIVQKLPYLITQPTKKSYLYFQK